MRRLPVVERDALVLEIPPPVRALHEHERDVVVEQAAEGSVARRGLKQHVIRGGAIELRTEMTPELHGNSARRDAVVQRPVRVIANVDAVPGAAPHRRHRKHEGAVAVGEPRHPRRWIVRRLLSTCYRREHAQLCELTSTEIHKTADAAGQTTMCALERYEVNCTTAPEGARRHDAITHIGCSEPRWRLTMVQAVRMAETGLHGFYLRDPVTGIEIPLRVRRHAGGVSYLCAYDHGQWAPHLLDLPPCPPPPTRRVP